jgi:hypothetical protein
MLCKIVCKKKSIYMVLHNFVKTYNFYFKDVGGGGLSEGSIKVAHCPTKNFRTTNLIN